MNLPDTTVFLTWLSQTDGRVQVTDANIQVWSNALATIPTSAVKAAALEHYRTNESASPTPAGLRKIALNERERNIAKQSALTAGPSKPDLTHEKIRRWVMANFRTTYDRGIIEGNAERAYWTKLRETGDQHQATQASKTVRAGL